MSNTQEARDRHRRTLAIEAMTGYLKELVPVMKTINQNLEEFVKIATPQKIQYVAADLEAAKQRALYPEGGE